MKKSENIDVSRDWVKNSHRRIASVEKHSAMAN
jgi:hypothetical protein